MLIKKDFIYYDLHTIKGCMEPFHFKKSLVYMIQLKSFRWIGRSENHLEFAKKVMHPCFYLLKHLATFKRRKCSIFYCLPDATYWHKKVIMHCCTTLYFLLHIQLSVLASFSRKGKYYTIQTVAACLLQDFYKFRSRLPVYQSNYHFGRLLGLLKEY